MEPRDADWVGGSRIAMMDASDASAVVGAPWRRSEFPSRFALLVRRRAAEGLESFDGSREHMGEAARRAR
jgi:hypothetical protein